MRKSKVVKPDDIPGAKPVREMSEAQKRLFGGASRDRIIRAPAEKRTKDGKVFGSILESDVYAWIAVLLDRSKFCLQPKFELQPKFKIQTGGGKTRVVQAIDYISDFLVGPGNDTRQSVTSPVPAGCLVIDAKGWKTPEFRMKEKMFMLRYGVEVRCVKNKTGLLDLLINYGFITEEFGKTCFKGSRRKAVAKNHGLHQGARGAGGLRSFAPTDGPGLPGSQPAGADRF